MHTERNPKLLVLLFKQVCTEINSRAGTGKKRKEQLNKQMETEFDRQQNEDTD